jgi:hypothetical protein
MRPQTWGKLTAGILVIGGVLVGLWVAFRPTVDPIVTPEPKPSAPLLADTHAVVRLVRAGSSRPDRATITCNGRRRSASGFWHRSPRVACDALASSRGALLSGPGCRKTASRRTRLHVTGAFGPRRFDHRAQDVGCPDVDQWLAVNALAAPILTPTRKATDVGSGERAP